MTKNKDDGTVFLTGLVHIGRRRFLAKAQTREHVKLLDAAQKISQGEPTDRDLAYMARSLFNAPSAPRPRRRAFLDENQRN